MYKSWCWEENQRSLINILFDLKQSIKSYSPETKEECQELDLLKSLQDHCCIREEIRETLRLIFKINII